MVPVVCVDGCLAIERADPSRACASSICTPLTTTKADKSEDAGTGINTRANLIPGVISSLQPNLPADQVRMNACEDSRHVGVKPERWGSGNGRTIHEGIFSECVQVLGVVMGWSRQQSLSSWGANPGL